MKQETLDRKKKHQILNKNPLKEIMNQTKNNKTMKKQAKQLEAQNNRLKTSPYLQKTK